MLMPLRISLSLFYRLYLEAGGPGARSPKRGRSGARVISVGNLEAGGGGKTPCAAAIAMEVIRRGGRPAVVSRGHGGEASGSGGTLVLEPGRGADPSDVVSLAGDEAMIYLERSIPLVIDRDRARGVNEAVRSIDPTHVILDDAFHRTGIVKDLDILLLDAERPFGSGRLLPAGTLREPPGAVRRADAVVFTRADGDEVPAEALDLVEGKPVFFARHVFDGLYDSDGAGVDPLPLRREHTVLFSGIARHGSFETLAAESGLEPDVSVRFDDHHVYSGDDARFIRSLGGERSVFVTTAKDWYKAASLFEGASLLRMDMRMEIEGLEELVGSAG